MSGIVLASPPSAGGGVLGPHAIIDIAASALATSNTFRIIVVLLMVCLEAKATQATSDGGSHRPRSSA
jgi:hypothetical protein